MFQNSSASLDSIPLARPWLGEAEMQQLAEVIASGWLTHGPKVAAFEKAVASYCSVPRALACNSATSALTAALRAWELGPGDEVLVPSLSFVATANVVAQLGATPVFVDVDPDTFCMSLEAAASLISSKTKVIMPVSQVGLPIDAVGFQALAKKHNLHLLEDAACAIGASVQGVPVGGQGHVTCFSFHPRKIISTGEGGMIVGLDEAFLSRCQAWIAHGVNMGEMERHRANNPLTVDYILPGYNFRMSDLQAAVGIAQWQRLSSIIARRRRLGLRYTALLADVAEFRPQRISEGFENTYQSYMGVFPNFSREQRNQVIDDLKARSIACTAGIQAIHRFSLYNGKNTVPLPQTEWVADRSIILPLFPEMTDEQQERVVGELKGVLSIMA